MCISCPDPRRLCQTCFRVVQEDMRMMALSKLERFYREDIEKIKGELKSIVPGDLDR